MNFKSFPQLLHYFKDEQKAVKYYEAIRWNGNPTCPHCKATKPYVTNRGYKCSNSDCYKKFTVKVGTIFENSKIPMKLWFAAIYLCTSHKKGISSVQLAIDLGVTQKTAWYMWHRIREMLKAQAPQMLSKEKVIEADETYIGGKEENRHKAKRLSSPKTGLAYDGTQYNKKKVVIGVIERNGMVILKHIPDAKMENTRPFLENAVPLGAKLMTDEASGYKGLSRKYKQQRINHTYRIYVRGEVHTNTIENFWSLLKRSLYGIYHQVSEKHLERYLNEFAARFNARNVNEFERLEIFLSRSEGGLLYKNLTAND